MSDTESRASNAAERMADWTRQHEPVRLDPATFRALAFEALEEAENEIARLRRYDPDCELCLRGICDEKPHG